MYICEIKTERRYITITTSKGWRYFKIEVDSIKKLAFDEVSGKLIVELKNEEVIEIQPQTMDDRDTISSLLVLLTIAPDPAILDITGKVLKPFSRATAVLVKLVLTLYEGSYANWKKLSEISDELAGIVKSSRELWGGVVEGEVNYLLELISQRDAKRLVASLKNITVSIYESAKLSLAKILPGSSSESLLDLALALVLNSTMKSLNISLPEKEVASLEDIALSTLKRFSKIFNVDSALLKDLESFLSSTSSPEEFVDKVVEVLKNSLKPIT